jgi:hypothetical protein
MSCTPQPQVVSTTTCNTFNTSEPAATAVQIFEQGTGRASGYVTLTNFNASGGEANISTDAIGTAIIATALPDNSFTVYVPSLQNLYVFSSTDGVDVIGQVTVNVYQTVRP